MLLALMLESTVGELTLRSKRSLLLPRSSVPCSAAPVRVPCENFTLPSAV